MLGAALGWKAAHPKDLIFLPHPHLHPKTSCFEGTPDQISHFFVEKDYFSSFHAGLLSPGALVGVRSSFSSLVMCPRANAYGMLLGVRIFNSFSSEQPGSPVLVESPRK